MPRTVNSNGIRPELRARAIIKLGVPITISEINDYIGSGDYGSKYVCMLKTVWGFTFTVQKNGRKVVSYTMVAEPKNGAELRALQPKVKKSATKAAAKAVKKPKAARTVAKSKKSVSATATSTKAAAFMKFRENKKIDEVAVTLGSTGEVTSYGLDPDWDSMEGVDVKALIV
jgi:hypothetical protein